MTRVWPSGCARRRSRKAAAGQIRQCLLQTVEAVIQAGPHLIAVKEALRHVNASSPLWHPGLLDESQATRLLRQSEIDVLLTLGVPVIALARDPGESGSALTADRVVFVSENRFEFARNLHDAADAVDALIVPARDESRDLVDLVAARLRE